MQDLLVELLKGNRQQRHDFLNYLQVIWGYVKLNRNDQAVEYIQEVVAYLQSLRCLNNILTPELAANLSAKVLEVGMQENFSLKIPEPVEIDVEDVHKVEIFLEETWGTIKEIVFSQETKLELTITADNLIIDVLSENDKHSTEWDKLKDIVQKSDFKYKVTDKRMVILFRT